MAERPAPSCLPDAGRGTDDLARALVEAEPRVRAFVRRLLRGADAQSHDDLVQETVARAWRSRATLDPARGVEAWLLRIAFRAFLDARQRQRQRPAAGLADSVEPVGGGADPVDHASQRERLDRLLAGLGDRERDVLLAFHRDGRSIAEIAAAMSLPEGTIKSHLHRARARVWAIEQENEQEDRR